MAEQQKGSMYDTFSTAKRGVKRLASLYVEKIKLKTTEKTTILLSSIAFIMVLTVVGFIFLIFVSIGVGHLLAVSIAPHLAYLIIAAFYLVLFIVVWFLRRPLFINPISRFVSRLIVDEPDEPVKTERKEPEDAREPHIAVLIKEGDKDSISRFKEKGGQSR